LPVAANIAAELLKIYGHYLIENNWLLFISPHSAPFHWVLG